MREMSEERDVIRGKLKQIVFRNDDNGYTVARFIVDDLQQRQVPQSGGVLESAYGHFHDFGRNLHPFV